MRKFQAILLAALTLSSIGSFGSYAMAMGPKPPPRDPQPIGKPTDEPTGPIPGYCRQPDVLLFSLGLQTTTYYNLDYYSCTYRSVSESPTWRQLVSLAHDTLVKNNLDPSNNWTIEEAPDFQPTVPNMPEIDDGRCHAPSSTVRKKPYQVAYTIPQKDLPRMKCQKLDFCLQNTLTDPREILLARQWQNKLNCSAYTRR